MPISRSLSGRMLALVLSMAGCGGDSRTANPVTTPSVATQPTENAKSVELGVNLRQLDIPKREIGYYNFDSCLLTSDVELESFLADVKGQQGWNNRGAFVPVLRAAKIDFTKSVLLLVRHTEGSGSIRVWVEPPVVRSDELVVAIGKEVPSMATSDMAFYCFALVVPCDVAQRVRITGSTTPWRRVMTEGGQKTLKPGHQDDIVFDL